MYMYTKTQMIMAKTRRNYLFLFFIYLGITVTTALCKEVTFIVFILKFRVVHEGKGQSPDPAIFFLLKK